MNLKPVFIFMLAVCCFGCAKHRIETGAAYRQAGGVSSAQAVVNTARSVIGAPYKYGGDSPAQGFDCSGLVWWVYRVNGYDLPRVSYKQWGAGRKVTDRLMPGDIVFYRTYTGKGMHTGIYTGKETFVHSPKSGGRVREEDTGKNYWQRRYLGAKRIIFR